MRWNALVSYASVFMFNVVFFSSLYSQDKLMLFRNKKLWLDSIVEEGVENFTSFLLVFLSWFAFHVVLSSSFHAQAHAHPLRLCST